MSAILLALLQQDAIPRIYLSQLIGVSAATITNLVAELIEQGLVEEEDNRPDNEQRIVGRPQKPLHLIPQARYAVGIHIDVGAVHVSLTDLLARALEVRSLHHPIDQPARNVLADTSRLVNDLIDQHNIAPAMIIGAGVGASGLVDPVSGTNLTSPNLGWSNVPIREVLSAQLNLPVSVDNNVRAMALGECLFGKGKGVHTLAFVYGHIGVGAGLVLDGQLYRGAAAGAGEIGHTTIMLQDGEMCHCGNTGCLETLVSEPSLIAAADGPTDIDQIFTLARDGHESLRTMLHERARYLGVALANLVNVFNPELIVLGGIFARGQDLLLPTVEATMRQRAFGALGEQVHVQTTSFDDYPGTIGAAALALDAFFYRPQLYPLQEIAI